MITPADFARMLANAADKHTQMGPSPDTLMYTSQSEKPVQYQDMEPGTLLLP